MDNINKKGIKVSPPKSLEVEIKGVKAITLKGEKGEKGDKGDVYADGVVTIRGRDGEDGKQGEKGEKGEKGDKGERGEQGLRGLPGDKGEKGDKGDIGFSGKDGKDGKDGSPDTAEEIADKLNTLLNKVDFRVLRNIPDFVTMREMSGRGGGGGGIAYTFQSAGSTIQNLITTLNFSTGITTSTENGVLTITGGATSPLTTKGDIYTYSTTNARLPIGTDNQVLIANSAATTGNSWSDIKTINGASLIGSGNIVIDATVTLADISANSTTAPTSLYTMTPTIPVEFRRSAGSTLLYLDETNGRIGIGTNAPSTLLHVGLAGTTLGTIGVAGSTSGLVTIQPAAAAGTWTLTLPTSGGTSGQFLQTDGSGVTSWATVASGITIDTTTITGGADKQVLYNNSGVVSSEAAFVYDYTNNALTVGTARLHSTGTNNNFLGASAGNFTLTSVRSTVFGDSAGSSLTSGNDNTLIGYLAGGSNDTINSITAIGSESLRYWNSTIATPGHTAVGYQAGRGSTTASSNTAVSGTFIGYQAGRSLTTGSNPTFIGYQAGYSNTTGTDNTFIGYLAGTNNTTNSSEVFIGSNAGRYIDTLHNLAIGYQAGRGSTTVANNTGAGNLSIGYQSLMNITSGAYNVAIGYQSGTALTSGSNNIFIGYQAGYSSNTGSQNTFIGYQSGYSQTVADYNQNNTFIGYQAGYSNVTADLNTYIGWQSGKFATGRGNTAIGAVSAQGLTTGAWNTFIGDYSGRGISTGSYNVHIGLFDLIPTNNYSSTIVFGYQAYPTANNQLVIGSNNTNGSITDAYFGQGVTKASPAGITINATGGSGTNNAGASLTIAGGKGTGNAAGGDIVNQTSVKAASSSTIQTLGDRQRILAKYTDLTESTDTAFASITVATSGTVTGGYIMYTVEANDGTDYQSLSGCAPFSVVNKAGTLTLVLGTDTQSSATSAGTLTGTLTLVASGTTAQFKMNAVSSLTQTTLRINCQVFKNFNIGVIAAI